eukprot:1158637-Pelagomonas_calceolata.AAC.6
MGSENTPYINEGKGDTLAQRAVSLPHQRVRGKTVWVWGVSDCTQPQGTRSILDIFASMARLVESTRCEGEIRGLLGFVGQGLTKIATNRGAGIASSLIRNTGVKRYGGHAGPEGLKHSGAWTFQAITLDYASATLQGMLAMLKSTNIPGNYPWTAPQQCCKGRLKHLGARTSQTITRGLVPVDYPSAMLQGMPATLRSTDNPDKYPWTTLQQCCEGCLQCSGAPTSQEIPQDCVHCAPAMLHGMLVLAPCPH